MTTGNQAPSDPTGAEAGKEQPKTYTQEEWDGLQSKLNKRNSLIEKQRDTLEVEKGELLAFKESVEETKGKTDEELIKIKQDYTRKAKLLERREVEMISRELKHQAEVFAKEYGVSVDELLEFKSPVEMELAAIKASMNKKKEEKLNPPSDTFDRRSGSAGGSRNLEALRSEDPNKMDHAAAVKHSEEFADEFAKEWNRRR